MTFSNEVDFIKDFVVTNHLSNLTVLDVGSHYCKFGLNLHSKIEQINKLVCIDDFEGKIWSEMLSSPFSALEGDLSLLERAGIDWPKNVLKGSVLFQKINIQDYAAIEENLECFELVILRDVLHLFASKSIRSEILQCVAEILAEEGKVYVRVANTEHPYRNDADKRVFSRAQFKKEIQDLGFHLSSEIVTSNNGETNFCVISCGMDS